MRFINVLLTYLLTYFVIYYGRGTTSENPLKIDVFEGAVGQNYRQKGTSPPTFLVSEN